MAMDISPLLNEFPIEIADKKPIFQGDFPALSPNCTVAVKCEITWYRMILSDIYIYSG